jgi:hypothetical protein
VWGGARSRCRFWFRFDELETVQFVEAPAQCIGDGRERSHWIGLAGDGTRTHRVPSRGGLRLRECLWLLGVLLQQLVWAMRIALQRGVDEGVDGHTDGRWGICHQLRGRRVMEFECMRVAGRV